MKTGDIKLISDYTGLNFIECVNLDCFVYRQLFADALITKLSATEQGKQYLDDCYVLRQTNPDKKALHEYGQDKGL